jgi:hypothetical protein
MAKSGRIRSMDGERNRVSVRDVMLVAAAVAAIICANVGLVRALDVALDAVHAEPTLAVALNR